MVFLASNRVLDTEKHSNVWRMAGRKEKENQKKKKREGGGFKIEGVVDKGLSLSLKPTI